MNRGELQARLQALAKGGLKGRHVYGVPTPPAGEQIPAGVETYTIDCVALLSERDWPRGERERHTAVARAFGQALAAAGAQARGPLLLLIEHADPLVGELQTLTPVFERFQRDDRMALFCCAERPSPPALVDAPPQLVYHAGAALRRLRNTFGLETVEAE